MKNNNRKGLHHDVSMSISLTMPILIPFAVYCCFFRNRLKTGAFNPKATHIFYIIFNLLSLVLENGNSCLILWKIP